jgi:hypothetical protein
MCVDACQVCAKSAGMADKWLGLIDKVRAMKYAGRRRELSVDIF